MTRKRKSGGGRAWLAAALCSLAVGPLAGPVQGEEEPTAEERIADLERRVTELEEALRAARQGEKAPDTAELRRRIDLLARELEKARMGDASGPRDLKSIYGLGPAASKVYEADRGVSVAGYGEGLYEDFDAERDDGVRTGKDSQADLLRAVLYFGYRFNDRIVFNSEIEFEHASTGEGGEVSVEFATLDFLLRDQVNVRAGLLLVPMGFINEMHEPPTFLGARRPDVERSVIPATWRENGVGIFGDLGPFSYRAYAVNGFDAAGFSSGSGLRGGRQDGAQASARDIALTARADYQGVPGLLAGASVYRGESGQGAEDTAGRVIDGTVTMYDLHAEYRFRGLQVRGLWTVTDLEDADRISETLLGLDPSDPNTDLSKAVGRRMTGWYGQVGYDVLAWMGDRTGQAVIPFVRYERLDTQDRVPSGFVSTGANDVRITTYGVAWKPIPNLSVKLDLQDFERGDGTGTDQVNAAIGYLF